MSIIIPYPDIQKQYDEAVEKLKKAREKNQKEIQRSNTTLRAFNDLLWNMPEGQTKDKFIKICQEEERTALNTQRTFALWEEIQLELIAKIKKDLVNAKKAIIDGIEKFPGKV